MPFERLTIIGLGLIGGSLAMAARERFPDCWIQAIDVAEAPLQYAIKAKAVDKVSLFLPDTFEENHLVVLAAHLSDNLRLLDALAPLVRGKDILVSDIGSCKRQIAQLGRTLLPAQFIGGHPMAGKERSGIEHATPLLFAGKSFLLCPHEKTPEPAFERLKRFMEGIGALPRPIEPDRHDRYMAYVSHLPQLYAILLTNILYRHEPGHLLSYHGGGIDDQLRLAASPYAMWRDIYHYNQDNIRMALQELGETTEQVGQILDSPELGEWFDRANQVHQEFNKVRPGKQ